MSDPILPKGFGEAAREYREAHPTAYYRRVRDDLPPPDFFDWPEHRQDQWFAEKRAAAAKTGTAPPNPERSQRAQKQRIALRQAWPEDFDRGARDGLMQQFDGLREKGGYPLGFHNWPLQRRNAYFAGYNKGRLDRLSLKRGGDHD
ncbi:hypothetical protein [Methylocystis sp.]|uniref:hypothetical protein n=1 Tax=Methylocystis sp. TaxID=1911079 RepID=UPI0025DB1711|nr:hypothetical protein [Methylocystis sp.]